MHLQVKGELELGLRVRVVDFEEAVHELFQVNIAATVEVENSKEALADDARQLTILL